jgi:prephenate dehydratase
MTQVSFQGERGAYSEAAAKNYFQEEIETIPCQTFSNVIENTQNKTKYGIIPVENSIEGSVGESYDALFSLEVNVIGETYFRIEHCLIGTGKIEEIDSVYSHPQALGQCRKFIEKNNFKTIPTYDTAGSVEIIKKLDKKNCACIASRSASEIHEIPIIAENISNNPNNYTRFLIIGEKNTEPSGKDKTSIIFSIKHEPGSLFKIIEKFHNESINLTKIESRPTKLSVWEYNFFVDFEGHREEPQIKNMLKNLKEETTFLKILGSYASAKVN